MTNDFKNKQSSGARPPRLSPEEYAAKKKAEKPYVGTETVSWMCILGAAPFAALGFVKYNGMTAEKFIYAWIKSEFLMPKKLTFRSTNTYYELFKPSIEAKAKEAMKSND